MLTITKEKSSKKGDILNATVTGFRNHASP